MLMEGLRLGDGMEQLEEFPPADWSRERSDPEADGSWERSSGSYFSDKFPFLSSTPGSCQGGCQWR